ncbi:MAG: protein kinase domain-containing protein [Planctomycetia bacterium]
MLPDDEARLADVLDFVEQYEADRARGVERTLAQWLERFPRSQSEVAAEWLALVEGRAKVAPANKADSGSEQVRSGADEAPSTARIGRYELLRELGRGGQGTVHLARDTRLHRNVALKVLSGGVDALQSNRIERLRREAEVIARLDHPSLCAILDADLAATPPWMAMRLVQGETLASALVRAKRVGATTVGGIPLPPRTAAEVRAVCALFERAARALHVAHESGIVHRDVKPGNLMVDGDGKPVLLDFGMAEDRSLDHQLTMHGDVFGTPDYMAPEQVDGRRSEVGPATDVWALAASLHEALTLERPFQRDSLPATFDAIRKAPARRPGDANEAVGRDLDVIVATALEKDPGRRYATALEFAEDLRRFREFEPIRARPAGWMLRLARWARRNPAIATASFGGFAALGTGLGITLHLLALERAALSNALGRHLAQRAIAVLEEDGSRALLLGAEAMERAPNWMTRGTLSRVLEANFLERRFVQPQPARLCNAIAVSPDGELLAMAFDDGTVRVARLSDGLDVAQRRFVLAPRDIAFDDSGEHLCIALDSSLELCSTSDLGTKSAVDLGVEVELVSWAGQRWIVAAGTWSALDKETLADEGSVAPLRGPARHVELRVLREGANAGRIRLLLLDDGAHVVELGEDALGVLVARELEAVPQALTASLSFDGASLASSSAEGDIRLLHLEAGASTAPGSLRLDPPANLLEWAPGGDWLVLGCNRGEEDSRAWALDAANLRLVPLPGHQGKPLDSVCPTIEDGRVWTTGGDLSLCLSDLSTGQELARTRLVLRAGYMTATQDGARIILRSTTGTTIQVMHAGSRPDALILSGHRGAIRLGGFGPDDRSVHAIDATGEFRMWDAATGRSMAIVPSKAPLRSALHDARKRHALVVDVQGGLASLDLTDGTRSWSLDWGAPVLAADISVDGRAVAVVDAQGAWLARPDGTRTALVAGELRGACFDASGELVLVFSNQDTATIHRTADATPVGACVWNPRGGASGASKAIPLGDGWAIHCSNLLLRYYDRQGREVHRAMRVPEAATLKSTRDQRILPVGRSGRALRLMQPGSDEPVWPRVHPNQPIVAADIDPVGRMLCAIASDQSLILSDMRDGSPWLERKLEGAAATACALSNDGSRLLVGQADGHVRVLDCDPEKGTRSRLPRPLDEWELQRERELALPLEFTPALSFSK